MEKDDDKKKKTVQKAITKFMESNVQFQKLVQAQHAIDPEKQTNNEIQHQKSSAKVDKESQDEDEVGHIKCSSNIDALKNEAEYYLKELRAIAEKRNLIDQFEETLSELERSLNGDIELSYRDLLENIYRIKHKKEIDQPAPLEWTESCQDFKIPEFANIASTGDCGGSYTPQTMSRHFLFTGSSGAGKTRSGVIPVMNAIVNYHCEDQSRRSALLVIDPKGDLREPLYKCAANSKKNNTKESLQKIYLDENSQRIFNINTDLKNKYFLDYFEYDERTNSLNLKRKLEILYNEYMGHIFTENAGSNQFFTTGAKNILTEFGYWYFEFMRRLNTDSCKLLAGNVYSGYKGILLKYGDFSEKELHEFESNITRIVDNKVLEFDRTAPFISLRALLKELCRYVNNENERYIDIKNNFGSVLLEIFQRVSQRVSLLNYAMCEKIYKLEVASGLDPKILNEIKTYIDSYNDEFSSITESALSYIQYCQASYVNTFMQSAVGSLTGSLLTDDELTRMLLMSPIAPSRKIKTLRISTLIEDGMIVYFSPSMNSKTLANQALAKALKKNYFKLTLSRSGASQVRACAYVCDEAQRFLTDDEETGEQNFLDKCRAFRAICVLATQSISSIENALLLNSNSQNANSVSVTSAIKIMLENISNKFFFSSTDLNTANIVMGLIGRNSFDQSAPHILDVRPLSSLKKGECYFVNSADGAWGREQIRIG